MAEALGGIAAHLEEPSRTSHKEEEPPRVVDHEIEPIKKWVESVVKKEGKLKVAPGEPGEIEVDGETSRNSLGEEDSWNSERKNNGPRQGKNGADPCGVHCLDKRHRDVERGRNSRERVNQ